MSAEYRFATTLSLMIGAAMIVATGGRATRASGDSAVEAKVVGSYALPDIPLSSIEDFITRDRNIFLGSVGSDLWHDRNAPPNHFWMISDRGPNAKSKVHHEKRRTFPVPEFSPLILHVELRGKEIQILDKLPLVDSRGVPVTGLPNTPDHDETPYSYDGAAAIEFNPNGLDTEGLARNSHGDFWLCDEYSPRWCIATRREKCSNVTFPPALDFKGPATLSWRHCRRSCTAKGQPRV